MDCVYVKLVILNLYFKTVQEYVNHALNNVKHARKVLYNAHHVMKLSIEFKATIH